MAVSGPFSMKVSTSVQELPPRLLPYGPSSVSVNSLIDNIYDFLATATSNAMVA